MNADQARKAAEEINKANVSSDVKQVEDKIAAAANAGKFSYRHFGDLSEGCLDIFRLLDFKVKRCQCGPNETGIDFNW